MDLSRTFPASYWIGRRVFSRRGRFVIAAFLLSAVGLYAAMRLYLVYEAHRAVHMLTALEAVKLGDSEDSVRSIVTNYGGYRWIPTDAPRNEFTFVVDVNPWHFGNLIGHHARFDSIVRPLVGLIDADPRLRRFLGLRLWLVNGGIRVSSDRVVAVDADVIVEGSDEWLGAMWQLDQEIPASRREYYVEAKQTWPELSRYLVGWSHLHVGSGTGEEARAWITPAASDSEMAAARHINLSCLTSQRGCWALCSLMPQVVRYHREHPQVSWGGTWGEPERTCD